MNISKKWYVGAVLIVLIVGTISVYIYYTKNDDSAYDEYYFELSIESENQTTILWPIPYDSYNEGDESYGNLSDLVYDLKITKGNGSIEVNKTQRGRALKINFVGQVKIKGKKTIYSERDENHRKRNKYYFDDLTMKDTNKSEGESHLVYSSTNNVKIDGFNCHRDNVGKLDSVRMIDKECSDVTLQEGWQSVEF